MMTHNYLKLKLSIQKVSISLLSSRAKGTPSSSFEDLDNTLG
jgi:hypothetical protein